MLDLIVAEHLEPDARELYIIVGELLGRAPHDTRTVDCAASGIGQILYYYHAGPIVSRLHPNRAPVPERLDALVDHVWTFTMGGIERSTASAAPGTP